MPFDIVGCQMIVLAWSVVQSSILADIHLRRVVSWEASSQVPLCRLLPWLQPPAEGQAGLLRAASWGSGHWGLALPPLPVAQVFTESSVHGSVLCTHWIGLAGRGGKLTLVSQAQIPPRPRRPQLGVAGSGDPEAWAAPPV